MAFIPDNKVKEMIEILNNSLIRKESKFITCNSGQCPGNCTKETCKRGK